MTYSKSNPVVAMLLSSELIINHKKDTYKVDLKEVHEELKPLVKTVINSIINQDDISISDKGIRLLERYVKAPLVFAHLKTFGIDLMCDDDGVVYSGKAKEGLDLSESEIAFIASKCDGMVVRDVNAIKNMLKLKKKVLKQSSYVVANRLFDFAKCNSLEITEKGNILAYKVIRNDYTDCHTGKIDNHVGSVVSMPRNRVDDNDNNTCSSGLHVCSAGYIKHFGNGSTRLVQVEVKPKDFVSIPHDYNDSKARVCSYKVVREFNTKEIEEILNIDLTPQTQYSNEEYHDMSCDSYNHDSVTSENEADICPECDYEIDSWGECECEDDDWYEGEDD